MTSFDNREVPVLDALSIIVMLEHCDFDWTIATFWMPHRYDMYTHLARGLYKNHYLPAPIKNTWCLQCVLNMVGRTRISDGRADLIEWVKDGRIQIESLGLRDDITRCPRCGQIPNNVNPLWRENL